MSAKSNFKAAVVKAKKLYKTGRYSKFSDAVKAAYKGTAAPKRKVSRKPARKRRVASIGAKEHKRYGTVKKYTRRPTVKSHQRRVASLGAVRATVKDNLAKALLAHDLATTVKATKAARKRIIKNRKILRVL